MTALGKIDMTEATRLTRLGRLAEAMAILRGEAPGKTSARDAGSHAGAAGPDILDMRPPDRPGGAWTSPLAAASAGTASTAATSGAPQAAAEMTGQEFIPSGYSPR